MNTLLRSLISVTALSVASLAFAQTWTVNGTQQTQALSTNDTAIAINPADGTAAVKTGGVGPTVSINFGGGANNNQIAINGNFTVSWSTQNMGTGVTCAPTGGIGSWSTATAASGTLNLTAPASAQSINFTLNCSGTGGAANNTAALTVVTSAGCPSPNLNGAPIVGTITPFVSLYGTPFPGTPSASASLNFTVGTYTAYQFVAPASTPQDGFFELTLTPNSGAGGPAGSLGVCPGVINSNLNSGDRECAPVPGKANVTWTLRTVLGGPSSFRCLLTPGQTYYLNLAFAACTSSTCTMSVSTRLASPGEPN